MPPEPPVQAREAFLVSAAVVLIGAGLLMASGWPLVLGGFVLMVLAVSMRP